MTDILVGLRDPNAIYLDVPECVAFMRAAADEIERLRMDNEDLRVEVRKLERMMND